MSAICSKCGLPKELCICETLAKEKEKIKIYAAPRRFGKMMTLVEGIGKGIDKKNVMKELKRQLACGGTLKDGIIELQGNHKERVKQILVKLGFSEDQIEVS